MRIVKKLARLGAAVLLSAMALSASHAQTPAWPQRAVKLILPLGAGSGVDITARLFAEKLSAKWGQPVVVENRPGGDGMVAITAFLSANDDHILLFGPTGSFTAHRYLYPKVPYELSDLVPVARVSSTLVAIAVPASLKGNTLKDLLDEVRASPGKLNWASATGTNAFLFEGFLKQSGLTMEKVPYRDTVQALNDLSEGRIQTYIGAYAIVRAQVQAGKVKVLAMTNSQRAAGAPDIPTAAEAGFPGLTFDGLTGFFGPKTLSAQARDRIVADVAEFSKDPTIIARLTATGQIIAPGTAAEFAAGLNTQVAQVAKVGETLGIKPAP